MSYNVTIDQNVDIAPLLTGKVELMAECVRYSLRVKPQDREQFNKAGNLLLPAGIGQTSIQSDRRIFCVGPDDYILIDKPSEQKSLNRQFKELGGKFTFSVTDISHRNVGFKLIGPHAVKMINVGCPLDLSLQHFPVGKCTRTIFENAEIMIFREEENEFQLETWRSFAPYMARYFEKYYQGK